MTSIRKWIKDHSKVIGHDVALFGAALLATGVLDTGSPITRDAIAAAVVTAGRRVLKQLLTAK